MDDDHSRLPPSKSLLHGEIPHRRLPIAPDHTLGADVKYSDTQFPPKDDAAPRPPSRVRNHQYPPPIIEHGASDDTLAIDTRIDLISKQATMQAKKDAALYPSGRRGAINSSPSRPVSSMSIPSIAEAAAIPPSTGDTSTSGATVLEHNIYEAESEIPFQHLRVLGRGTFGIVESVKCIRGPLQGRIFASKIIISRQLDSPRFAERIKSEVEIVHRLRHQHLVTIRQTYRWKHQFCMIMEPVADMDLETFLHDLDETEPSKRNDGQLALLVRWYGCLTDVLAYLFTQKIRHKDIKPPNILVKGSNVFLTDFGVAKDLVDSTTTATWGRAGTPMYSAPEVASMERHGRLADLFAMGAIFLELCTILAGNTLAEFKEFRGPPGEQSYAENTEATLKWMAHLGHEASQVVNLESKTLLHALLWLCSRMLQPEPEKRIGSIALRQLISGVSLNSQNSSEVWILGCTTCYPAFDAENCGISRATLADNFRTSLDKLAVEEPLREDCSVSWKDANAAGFDSIPPTSFTAQTQRGFTVVVPTKPKYNELFSDLDIERTIYVVDLYRDISSQTAKAMDCLLPNWRSNLAAISRSTVLEHKKDVLMYMARPGTNAQEVLRGLAYEDSHIYELEFESTFTTYLSQPQRRFLSYSEFAERHRLSSAQDPGQHRLTRFNFVVLLDRTKWALLDSTDPRHHFDHYRQRLEAPGDPVSELGMRFEASKKRPDSSYDIEARLFRGSGRPSYLVKNLVIERQSFGTIPWFGAEGKPDFQHFMCYNVAVDYHVSGENSIQRVSGGVENTLDLDNSVEKKEQAQTCSVTLQKITADCKDGVGAVSSQIPAVVTENYSNGIEAANPLVCPYCSVVLEFHSEREYKKHVLRHEKPFFCDVTGCFRKDGFSSLDNLNQHKKTKHGIRGLSTA